AGRREEPATATHLWHVVFFEEGSRRLPERHRRSQEARPSRARQTARSVFDPGTGWAGPDLLASEGRHHPQRDGRLDARRVPAPRLFARLHAARGTSPAVFHLGPRGLLFAEFFRRHGTRRRRVSPQAYELPGPHPDL